MGGGAMLSMMELSRVVRRTVMTTPKVARATTATPTSLKRLKADASARRVDCRVEAGDIVEAEFVCQWNDEFLVARVAHAASWTLLCFDQHAAHERVRLEFFMEDALAQVARGERRSGALRPIAKFKPTAAEMERLHKARDALQSWGFALELGGREDVVVSHVPIVRDSWLAPEAVFDFALDFERAPLAVPSPVKRLLASKACRGAVKFGDALEAEFCATLIRDLARCRLPHQCAHGRPSVVPLLEVVS